MTKNNSPTPFTSYAQNFEDVMLWRALKHVTAGVYVDVGAQHPVVDSVSKAFYEQGWRGIHVEPVPHYAELLRQDRPDEIVLQLALANRAGILDLHVVAGTGLSTGVKAYAQSLQATHGFAHQTIPTPMLPMSTALASLAGQQVHWLKIDVEGLEEDVLRGWDSKALRPWIILIEATVPMSTELRYEGADRILVNAGYRFVYFDGLNRFYIAAEHAELIPAFQTPPNVFDGVQLSGFSSSAWCAHLISSHRTERQADAAQLEAARAELARAENNARARLEEEKTRVHQAVMRAVEAEARASAAEVSANHANDRAIHAEARALLAGNTPLRRVATAIADGRIKSGIKRRIKTALRIAAIAVARHPALKRSAVFALSCIPPLRRRLQVMLAPSPGAASTDSIEKPLPMSPDTALVFRQLQLRQSQYRSEIA
ncbi:FkbM family methyltransferase [Variovorax boronicumulans]|uniref:FkbM family methyltransferase n=1 Tax=Variovorax boronicumulans TaxID=436515 RepID=UPI00159D2772|nr:FkbM family methyltransferase [Variovorax boronicumulans]MDQ0016916.1 FkbM family methyltransferase [Variovorax boronicumulans]